MDKAHGAPRHVHVGRCGWLLPSRWWLLLLLIMLLLQPLMLLRLRQQPALQSPSHPVSAADASIVLQVFCC